MFDIGFGEMVLLAAIALVAIGPKQLPEVARTLGRLIGEFKKLTGDFSRAVVDARDTAEDKLADTQRALNDSFYSHASPEASADRSPQAPGASAASPTSRPTPKPPSMPVEPVVHGPVSSQSVATMPSSASDEQDDGDGSLPQIQPAPEARPLGAVAASIPLPAEKKES